jgi:hypothetical protein
MLTYLPNIDIDGTWWWDQDAYELQVYILLEIIGASDSGRELLRELSQNGHHLWIAPQIADPSGAAVTGGPGATADSWRGETPAGQPLTGPGGQVYQDPNTGAPVLGTGTGSDVHLWFDVNQNRGWHVRDEDVLFHELVHALREMMALYLPSALGNHMDDTEEFYATLCTNIYLSENGRNGDLRGTHEMQWAPLPDALHDPEAFLNFVDSTGRSYRDLVARLDWDMSSFTTALNMLDATKCPFNPVRQWIQDVNNFWSVPDWPFFMDPYLPPLGRP